MEIHTTTSPVARAAEPSELLQRRKIIMSLRKSLFALTFIVVTSFFAAAQTTWTPEIQVKTKAIGSPRVSPDGKRLVYTVNEAVMTADKSEFVTQVWMATTDGKENYQVTFGEKSSTNPKWSPDGNSIAFTSNRKDSKNNLYVLRLMGGEAEPITDVKSAVGDFEWSPDGKWLAYSMTDPKADDEDKNDKGRNDYRWIDENIKMSRLYVVSVAKDANGKREPKKLTNENRHVTGFEWSPDGSRIVFSHVKSPVANDWPSSDVAIVEVATAKMTPFVATAAAEASPSFSRDGKWISMVVSDLPVRWAQSNNIVIFPVAGGTAKKMALSPDGQPNVVGWSADNTKIYFTEAKGTGTALYSASVATGSITEEQYADAVATGVSLNNDCTVFAFALQMADRPPEAFIAAYGRLTACPDIARK